MLLVWRNEWNVVSGCRCRKQRTGVGNGSHRCDGRKRVEEGTGNGNPAAAERRSRWLDPGPGSRDVQGSMRVLHHYPLPKHRGTAADRARKDCRSPRPWKGRGGKIGEAQRPCQAAADENSVMRTNIPVFRDGGKSRFSGKGGEEKGRKKFREDFPAGRKFAFGYKPDHRSLYHRQRLRPFPMCCPHCSSIPEPAFFVLFS